ncbi:hypothetical protein [Streptomyces sp. NPDC086989]|uniref:hypothetical protein n=1 Tax=Streptomyces sp. NPDC086989 TaxID=3365764 RepID=UPI0037F9A3A6
MKVFGRRFDDGADLAVGAEKPRSDMPLRSRGVAFVRGVQGGAEGAVRGLTVSEFPAPSRLQFLRFLGKVQLQDLQRTRDWIAVEEQRVAAEAVRRPAPPPPEWLIERGIGVGRLPVRPRWRLLGHP